MTESEPTSRSEEAAQAYSVIKEHEALTDDLFGYSVAYEARSNQASAYLDHLKELSQREPSIHTERTDEAAKANAILADHEALLHSLVGDASPDDARFTEAAAYANHLEKMAAESAGLSPESVESIDASAAEVLDEDAKRLELVTQLAETDFATRRMIAAAKEVAERRNHAITDLDDPDVLSELLDKVELHFQNILDEYDTNGGSNDAMEYALAVAFAPELPVRPASETPAVVETRPKPKPTSFKPKYVTELAPADVPKTPDDVEPIPDTELSPDVEPVPGRTPAEEKERLDDIAYVIETNAQARNLLIAAGRLRKAIHADQEMNDNFRERNTEMGAGKWKSKSGSEKYLKSLVGKAETFTDDLNRVAASGSVDSEILEYIRNVSTLDMTRMPEKPAEPEKGKATQFASTSEFYPNVESEMPPKSLRFSAMELVKEKFSDSYWAEQWRLARDGVSREQILNRGVTADMTPEEVQAKRNDNRRTLMTSMVSGFPVDVRSI